MHPSLPVVNTQAAATLSSLIAGASHLGVFLLGLAIFCSAGSRSHLSHGHVQSVAPPGPSDDKPVATHRYLLGTFVLGHRLRGSSVPAGRTLSLSWPDAAPLMLGVKGSCVRPRPSRPDAVPLMLGSQYVDLNKGYLDLSWPWGQSSLAYSYFNRYKLKNRIIIS